MIDSQIPIILASASPRRTELLKQAGFTFTVIPSSIEEQHTETSPDKLAEDLAFQKAEDVYQSVKQDYTGKDFMVIGADTIVYYDGEVLGKPADEQEAFDMLKMLSDRTHQVYTGDPLDKAGAYGIQGPFAVHVKKINGDYNNVVGLPIARLYQSLQG